MALLEVKDLSIRFDTLRGELTAVDRVNLSIEEGETLGIVGESGCGKSLTSLAIMGLLPPVARLSATTLNFEGKALLTLSESEYRELRGGDMAMIFQDPMTSLNPCFTVGFQLMEVLQVHHKGDRKSCYTKAVELLEQVGIADAERRMEAFPHQLSGGMCQRIMIACAVACKPKLLIADEPTTALDVTIQAQILELLRDIQKKSGMALILITHNLGIVAEIASRIAVMYAGQVVESGPTRQIIEEPRHHYTAGLLRCLPDSAEKIGNKSVLPSISGMVPDLVHRPKGCQFHPRCQSAQPDCRELEPPMVAIEKQIAKCLHPITGPNEGAQS